MTCCCVLPCSCWAGSTRPTCPRTLPAEAGRSPARRNNHISISHNQYRVALQIDLICHLQICRYVLSEVVVVVVCSWTQAVDGCNSLWNAAEFQERKKLAIALTAAWSLAAARRDLLYQQVRRPWGVILTKYCVDI